MYVSSKVDSLNPSPVLSGNKDLSVTSNRETVNLHVNSCVVSPVHFQRCFMCRLFELCKSNCCYRSTCRGQVAPVLGEVGSPWGQPQRYNSPQGRLHPPLSVLAKFDQVTHHHKLLCKSPKEPLLVGGIASAFKQKCSGTGSNSEISRVLQQFLVPKPNHRCRLILDLSTLNTFLNTESFKMETPETIRTSLQAGEWVTAIGFKDAYFHIPIHSQSRKYIHFHVQGWSQTQPPVQTYLRPEHLEHLPKHRVVQNGDTRDNKNLPTGRGVGYRHRFQRRLLPYTNTQSVQEVHTFSRPGLVLPVQGTTIWSVHRIHGVHSSGQRGQIDGFTEGYKDPPVPRQLVGQSQVPPYLSPAYTDLGSSLSRTRLAGEWGEIRTGSKTGFQKVTSST